MRRIRGILLCCLVLLVVAGVVCYLILGESRKFCRLRFGSTDPHEIILARTSNSLLLYRSGQLDEEPEEYPFDGYLDETAAIPPITMANGATYTIKFISELEEKERRYRGLIVHVKIERDVSFSQYCDVELKATSHRMKYAHFDGPLSIGLSTVNWEIPAGTEFVIGGEPLTLRAAVGTMDKVGGCWTAVESGIDSFPEDKRPTVTVEFPTAESTQPIIRTYPLDQVCCGALFYGPVSVPDGATTGTATLSFAFDSWPEADVAPSTWQLPIVDRKADMEQGGHRQ